MDTIRVLQVVAELGMGGIQSFIMNVYRNIDREKIQFDFLLNTDKKGVFEDEIEKLGGRVFRVSSRNESFLKNKRELEEFFYKHREYRCVHCHFSNLSYLMPLKIAARAGIPTRIIHSHSTHLPSNPLHKVLHEYNRRKLDSIATDFYACSDLAGKWLFGGTKGYEKQVIVNNGIQTEKYVYDEEVRKNIRVQLGVENKIVIANVGRLSEPKNHIFLLNVFAELKKNDLNTVLVLVGDGPEKERIENRIEELGIGNSVMMLGLRQDVPQLLQSFDCFLMPSKWEGFPVALIEAEAAGLPAYVSDKVTMQAKVNENVKYLSLDDGFEKWANQILDESQSWNRIKDVSTVVKAGYDIDSTVRFLEDKYISSYTV